MPRHSRLARLLQVACTTHLLLALGWLAWRWPVSAVQAVAGACTILLVPSAALALELLIVGIVGRSDPAPRPSVPQLVRAWLSETLHLYRTFYWRQPFRWRQEADHAGPAASGRVGVVLVHGFMCNRGFWNQWLRDLRARGHAFVAVNLEPLFAPIDSCESCIEEAVQRMERLTGRPPVLVCHSMGGLAARAWWRARGREGRLAHLVTIGTPHRGTWLARLSQRANGRQMRLASDWLDQLARDEVRRPLPAATCWYSNCDNVVFPASTATLPGADNRFVAGEPHVALGFHPQVRGAFVELLERLQGARQGESFTEPHP